MTNNNVQNVKFLRNGNVFTPSIDPVKTAREVALSAMDGQLNSLADGTAILGRYKETDGVVKTLVGFAYISGNTKTLTVFDVDGASANVDEKILSAIQALNAEKTSTDGKNVQVKVTEEDGKIKAVNITTDNTVNSSDVNTAITNAINKLDGSVVAESGFYVKSVTEADGKISGTTEALPTVSAISAAGKPITAVSENLGAISATTGSIDAQYVNINDAGGIITATNVEGALAEIAAEIDAMDLDVVSGDGEVITAVSEKDGKVSASKTAIKDVKLTGYVKNTTATGAISATDDIEDALNKLENTIGSNAISNTDGSITVTPSDDSTTDVKVHIKSEEKVIKLDSNSGGIYTDIKIASATPSSTTVKEEYNLLDSDGNALGASIKIYKDSSIVEIYLGTSGDSVNTKTGVITKLDGDKQYLNYVYVNADGKYEMTKINISVFITEQEFASGVTFDSTENKVKGVVDSTSESFLTVGANGFKLAGVQNAIDSAINALDATGGTKTIASDKHVAVEVIETDGKITTVTVVEDNIANAGDLTAEIKARKKVDGQDGDTYAVNANANYIGKATSLNDADVKLDAALKTLDDNAIKSVKVNDKVLTKTGNAVNVQISSTPTSETSESPIIVNTDDNGAVTLQISQIDCGTY